MYYLYILYSKSSDIYYIGHTDNYQRRFLEHNELSESSYTSKHRPWQIKAVFECGDERKTAMNIERFIKKQKSRSLIEKIIAGNNLEGILAQLVRVPHVRD
jgi:putative endonuclease